MQHGPAGMALSQTARPRYCHPCSVPSSDPPPLCSCASCQQRLQRLQLDSEQQGQQQPTWELHPICLKHPDDYPSWAELCKGGGQSRWGGTGLECGGTGA